MFQIQNLTRDPKQKQTLVLPNGETIEITIEYSPQQLGWFIPSLVYKDFEICGMRICVSPNMLYQYKNVIPFGLACRGVQQREPMLLDDFASEAAQLFILTEADVQAYAEWLSGQI